MALESRIVPAGKERFMPPGMITTLRKVWSQYVWSWGMKAKRTVPTKKNIMAMSMTLETWNFLMRKLVESAQAIPIGATGTRWRVARSGDSFRSFSMNKKK
jgi:hypothetical protein